MGAWGLGGFAKMAHQCRGQNVLNQGGLAGAADPGHANQALQRKFNRDVFQVVVAGTFQNQARRVLRHQPLKTHADLLAPAQVSARERIGMAQIGGGAVKHDLSAALARAGAHVDHAVGGQHHRRVVLHHHQRVAGVAQALHGHDDAVHVARVQANAGLVQHKQGVDQRGAQGRGEVDALHLAAAQSAALAVEREIANADIAQVFEAGGDFFKEEFEGLRIALVLNGACRVNAPVRRGLAGLHVVKKAFQAVQRQQHQVLQAQAWQGFELRAGPLHAHRHEALGGVQRIVSGGLAAHAPQQALGFQPRPTTNAAGRVAAVLGQQHPNVHFVRLGLQVFKEALDTKPVLVPLAVPVGRAVHHPILLLGRELVPGRVTRNTGRFGVAHQVVLALLPGGGLHGFDSARAQRQFVIGNNQAVIDPDHPAKAPAGVARAHGGVE